MFNRFCPGGGALLLLLSLAPSASLTAQPVPENPPQVFAAAYLAQAVPAAVAFDADGDLFFAFVRGAIDFNLCMRRWAPCLGSVDGLSLDRFMTSAQQAFDFGGISHIDYDPAIARTREGSVAVWRGESYCLFWGWCTPTDGSGSAIYGRRIGGGGPVGEVFQVNVHTEGNQFSPAVSVSPRGGFTVVWASDGGDRPGILARSFSEHGEPGAEFRVSASIARPQVAHGPGGEVLIVWEQGGVQAGLFDAGGMPLGHRHRIDDSVSAAAPILSALPDGTGYVVGWVDEAGVVRVRRLDASAWPAGPSVAATFPPEDQLGGYGLAADETGGVLVAWWGSRDGATGPVQGIFTTYLDGGGEALARSELLSRLRDQVQLGVQVASDGRRAYAVTWYSPIVDSVYPGTSYLIRRLNLPGGPCAADASHLCLQDRFEVEARSASGADGRAVPFAPSTGFFAFTDSAGWDLGVKILDTRGSNAHFSLVEANLCEPETWVRFTDTRTGAVRIDRFEANRLCGVRDGVAFDAELAPKVSIACRRGPATLCLLDGRFLVRLHGRPGSTGPQRLAGAVAGTDRSGVFWFSGADNPVAVVQMVDGRAINGKVWVLVGGLAPQPFTLTVTDLATGVRKAYTHAWGDVCSRMDKEAF